MSSIAARYGFADWRTIYDHPDNADLKAKRKKPEVLHPGDIVVVPDKDEKKVKCAAGATHTFRVKLPKTLVRLALQVTGSWSYELVVDDEPAFEGKTDGSAPIEHPIAADARSGTLSIWPEKQEDDKAREGLMVFPIEFGNLDPLEEVSGVQGTLANLGYHFGAIDGELGPETAAAISAFQIAEGMEPTGEIDEPLRAKLRAAHD